MGCDFLDNKQTIVVMHFNPRTHVGCDVSSTFIKTSWFLFQSTHPCGVRQRLLFDIPIVAPFQSTHPCGVRRYSGLISFKHLLISIHAPMWGATKFKRQHVHVLAISIHAPMWGATGLADFILQLYDISIHAPMWGATQVRGIQRGECGISIHAPMWGATRLSNR